MLQSLIEITGNFNLFCPSPATACKFKQFTHNDKV